MAFRCFFDVDGVVLDFESSFIKVVSNYFQLEVPENYQTENWFFSDLLTSEQVQEGWDYFLKCSEFENMPPLVDPHQFNRIFGAYPVHFVTNIPPDCLDRRQRNLKKIGYQFTSAHCAGFVQYDGHPPQTKADVIQNLLEDHEQFLFVDDHPDNCVNVHESFPEAEVWLMTRPHNQDFSHPVIRRALHWDDVFKHPREVDHEH
ncbi:MAG: hypothetical protein QF560_15565 [SAR324 cluster bacterium]|jgi:hypothetical protein|nr:hypothetical protein [Deltaproteobacteria bacterium]MDP6462516.1 hypothetical protein [SAR324 cluster bacterium]MBI12059.1 hypothetical protein [Deltaproteobacteria bacterium]MBP43439.1 hypothetical protein [Deltaproteobacteria bacterium]MDP7139778.1 hypothetical protein [SAR324 cluster bacterium]|tara:strand:+ start:107 stop:715 length:609 start_codon:yes stop_codon:yes gene_type:complete